MTTTPQKRVLYANPWWHHDFILAVTQEAERRGWELDLQVLRTGVLPEEWHGDGILTHLGVDLLQLDSLRRRAHCPIVSLNTSYPEFEAVRVAPDGRTVGRIAAEHFLDRYFQSFVCYGRDMNTLASIELYLGFADRLKESGYVTCLLDGNEPDHPEVTPSASSQRRLVRRLSALPHPTAVFAGSDLAATEVIRASVDAGLHIPDQIAVLGMMNMSEFRTSCGVSLSSIDVDTGALVRIACETLSRMMDGAPPPTERIVVQPRGIELRGSTDTLAACDPKVASTVQYMYQHFRERIGINHLCRVSSLTKSALYQAFQQAFGKTPYAILTHIRVEKAKLMLAKTDAKVTTVSADCGIGSSVNLYRQFKDNVGMSPSAYRRTAATE